MSVTHDLIQKKRSRILAIAGRHGATNLRIFGSVARGEAGPESDLDLLVDLEPGRSLLDHIALIPMKEGITDHVWIWREFVTYHIQL